jgi:hypothetical protein
MKKYLIVCALSFGIISFFNNRLVWGWDNTVTHKDLTAYAADRSVLASNFGDYLSNIGLENLNQKLLWPGQICDDKTQKTDCSIKDWLKYGAEKEDAEKSVEWQGRFQNHFHDPLKIDGEGLSDLQTQTQMSCLEWAQNSTAQSAPDTPEGDQSWPTLRQLYYDALTAGNETDRSAKFAQLFKGLGHQMHLVQDMAVPPHVRDDSPRGGGCDRAKCTGPAVLRNLG